MTNERIYCPDCEPVKNRRGDRVGGILELVERNYSGCGVDYFSCPECGHAFCVSYKVAVITRDEAWEDKEEVERLAAEKKERTAAAILKKLVEAAPGTVAHDEAMKRARQLVGK